MGLGSWFPRKLSSLRPHFSDMPFVSVCPFFFLTRIFPTFFVFFKKWFHYAYFFHRFLYVYRFCKIFAQNCLLPLMKQSLIRKLFHPPSKCIFLKAINYLNWWGIRKISQTWEIVNCISRCSTEELIRYPFYTTNSTSKIPNLQQNKSAFSHVFIFYRFYKDFKLLP